MLTITKYLREEVLIDSKSLQDVLMNILNILYKFFSFINIYSKLLIVI